MHVLYSLGLLFYFLALLPVAAFRRSREGKSFGRLGDRLGRVPESVNPRHERSVWIHAVSVGEVLAARSLLRDLRETYPSHRLLVSTTTVTGQQVARELGDAVDGVFYAPLDLPPFVTRTLDRAAADLVVFVDTEIWPNWLRACRRRGVKTLIVNGRISDRSYARYRLGSGFMRRVLEDVDRVCAQTEGWGRRFVGLGFRTDRLTVTGSLKFDALDVAATGADLHVGDRVLRYFSFTQERTVIVAASTLDGEDEPVLETFSRLRETDHDAVLILAPRHPERASRVLASSLGRGFETVLRSRLPADPPVAADVVVLDTVGELARLYQLATVVFVGGSLVPGGGHNILEPAVFARPILFGPHMRNFQEIADLFLRNDAAVQVRTVSDLETQLLALLRDPVRRASLGAAARALVDANRGARGQTMAVIKDLLPPGAPARADRQTLRAVP